MKLLVEIGQLLLDLGNTARLFVTLLFWGLLVVVLVKVVRTVFSQGTTAEAQAFKRACSKFGLGRYLYDLPIHWMPYDSQKKQLLSTPPLPKFLEGERLDNFKARAMHVELGKLLFIASNEHCSLASEVIDREVTSFTQLTISEASAIWKHIKALNEDRKNTKQAA